MLTLLPGGAAWPPRASSTGRSFLSITSWTWRRPGGWWGSLASRLPSSSSIRTPAASAPQQRLRRATSARWTRTRSPLMAPSSLLTARWTRKPRRQCASCLSKPWWPQDTSLPPWNAWGERRTSACWICRWPPVKRKDYSSKPSGGDCWSNRRTPWALAPRTGNASRSASLPKAKCGVWSSPGVS